MQPFCSPVILSTSTPAESGSNSSSSLKWRPRTTRRRSASNRQRQGASLIRASPEDTSDNCPLCQPRYSKSPERLLRMKQPQQPHHTLPQQPHPHHHHQQHHPPPPPPLRHKLSYGDLLASKRPPLSASASSNSSSLQKLGNRVRRSRSEFRVAQTRMNCDENNPLNFHLKLRKDHNGNLRSDTIHLAIDSSEYAEITSVEKLAAAAKKSRKKHQRVSRSKSRSASNCGLLTVWPGKAGIWLPQ